MSGFRWACPYCGASNLDTSRVAFELLHCSKCFAPCKEYEVDGFFEREADVSGQISFEAVWG